VVSEGAGVVLAMKLVTGDRFNGSPDCV